MEMNTNAVKFSLENSSFRSMNALTVLSRDNGEAFAIICSPNILGGCEFAIGVVTKTWLNSAGDPLIEALTQPTVVQAILECNAVLDWLRFYILDQLTRFDENNNLETASQILVLQELTLLLRKIEGQGVCMMCVCALSVPVALLYLDRHRFHKRNSSFVALRSFKGSYRELKPLRQL
ncbi:hypothetical protein VNO77_27947 [Canavalia gladiata]|uniref:Uncharacterized protein n=1 Tax=Canavalia gladiata TaxID=3824 RepID=A0AAN9Q701_CANGL